MNCLFFVNWLPSSVFETFGYCMRHSTKFVPFCHGMRSHFQVSQKSYWVKDYFIFSCLVINCPVLDSPPKSVLLTIPCVRTYGSKCSFTCQTGYSSLTGNVTRTCLASGLWSGNSINCSGEWLPCFISTRTQLFKRWIVISTVEISIQWLVQLVSSILFHWREIYPMYSARAIYLLSNWGLIWPQVIHTFCTFYGPWDK